MVDLLIDGLRYGAPGRISLRKGNAVRADEQDERVATST
jgi:hypothetical protein